MKKIEVSQIARKYILQMEIHGYLSEQKVLQMREELNGLGIGSLDFTGTTLSKVEYGEHLYLEIKGVIKEKYYVRERKTSTAKN